MTPAILANQFIDKLIEGGIVGEGITHVIIDAKVGDIVKIHTANLEVNEDKLGVIVAAALEARVDNAVS